jgi:hypothetical protein
MKHAWCLQTSSTRRELEVALARPLETLPTLVEVSAPNEHFKLGDVDVLRVPVRVRALKHAITRAVPSHEWKQLEE